MPVNTQGRLDDKIDQGKAHFFALTESNFLQGSNLDILVQTGGDPIDVYLLELAANAFDFTWSAYIGTEFQSGTGTEVLGVPRNLSLPLASGLTMISDPTITNIGALAVGPQRIVGTEFNGSGLRSSMQKKIISIRQVLSANTSYMFRITNNDEYDRATSVNIITTRY